MSMNGSLASIDAAELAGLQRDPQTTEFFIEDRFTNPRRELHLHKMWHALHFLLTGTAWDNNGPLGQALLGGEDIGPNMGYGPARLLLPDEVSSTAAALAKISTEEFRSRFAPSTMEAADIYPSVIWVREQDTVLDELTPLFEELAAFYSDAARRGDSILLWMI